MVPTFSVDPQIGEAFDAMVAELVEYRIARYLLGKEDVAAGMVVCKLSHTGGRPILFLDRNRFSGLPEGNADFVADGHTYTGHFVKVALNVATLPGESGNALPALLRSWFGPSAGHPGTSHHASPETASRSAGQSGPSQSELTSSASWRAAGGLRRPW